MIGEGVSPTLQMVAWFLATVEFALAFYVLALNVRHSANRHLGGLLFLFALNNVGSGITMGALTIPQARWGTYLLAVTSASLQSAMLLVAVSLVKPEWMAGKRRWIWGLVYAVLALPLALTLVDVLAGTRLYYTGLEAGYVGGFAPLLAYTQGSLSLLVRIVGIYLMGVLPIGLLAYAAFFDWEIRPLQRRLAGLLLTTQLAAVVMQFVVRPLFGEAIAILVLSFILILGYGYATFRQMISERRMQRGRLQWRLSAAVLALSLPLLISISLLVNLRVEAVLRSSALNALGSVGQSLAAYTQARLDSLVRLLEETVALPDVRAMDPDAQGPVLQSIAAVYPDLLFIATSDLTGVNVARSDGLEPRDYGATTWFQQAARGELALETRRDELHDLPLVIAASPIRDGDGRIVGVGIVHSSMAELMQRVEASRVGENGLSYIFDEQNQLIAHAGPALLADLDDAAAYPPVAALRAGEQGVFGFSDADGAAWIAFILPLPNGWGVVVQQPEAELRQLQAPVIQISWLVTVLAATLLLAATALAIRQAVGPIESLTQTARAISRGDLTREAPVETEDEVGALAETFNLMTARVRTLVSGLERSVEERTLDLARRSQYLEASAEVGRTAATILETDVLLERVVDLIREHFGLYYVGLFLVDEAREWAVLRAGTGEAGAAMLARNHRIRIGSGMIGWAVEHGEARVASTAEADAVRLATSELPDTRSEAALPLRSRGRVLGALTVQSAQADAFDGAALTALQVMADQVAVAIDNAQLYSQAQSALEAERRIYGERTREAWAELLRARPDWGYVYSRQADAAEGRSVLMAARGAWSPAMQEAARTRRIVRGEGTSLAVPIAVREQVLGVLNFTKAEADAFWSTEEVTLLETLSVQLGQALESAQLYRDTQLRAGREQLLREITDTIGRAADLPTLMRVTAEELNRVLGSSRVSVRLGMAADETPTAGPDERQEGWGANHADAG